jgi:acetylornithine deacetylase
VRINTVGSESNLPLIDTVADHLSVSRAGRRQAGRRDPVGPHRHGALGRQAWCPDLLGAELRCRADIKGFIGLVVAQAEDVLHADLSFAVHLAFSYEEEVGCFGVRHLIADLQEANLAPELCIIGEPAGMVPAIAHKGVHRWRCCVKGRAAHSSQTDISVSAVEAGARVVARIAELADGMHNTTLVGFGSVAA